MKFAHLADIHLGAWREPKLRELGTAAFREAMRRCVGAGVDFVLISGDLFNTSLPPIDSLKTAVSEFRKLKKKGISVYVIAGSHDHSPSGKTMLEVLEEAGLVVNVFKGDVLEGRLNLEFTVDAKTDAKIVGMIGKRGMLERKNYENLIKANLEEEEGFKIFMFHTALEELRPKELEMMEAAPLSLLPKGFDYYAGGHVHIVNATSAEGYRKVVYPGPTFPNSFSELEKLRHGGFYIYDDGKTEYQPLEMCKVVVVSVDCDGKSPQDATKEVVAGLQKNELEDSILLLRMSGVLGTGKTSDIGTSKMMEVAHERGAYVVLKNTSKLKSKEFEEVKVGAGATGAAEEAVIDEHLGQIKSLGLDMASEKELVRKLMSVLDMEKQEGEKQADYESRIISDTEKVIGAKDDEESGNRTDDDNA
jgi:DNA repair exonuclease SbcCD nuclease subunit